MWSDTYKSNIDLTFSAFRKLPKAAHPAPCPAPTNGQLPSSSPNNDSSSSIECSPPKVSLVLLAGNSGTHAIQSLLEMFRTAHEVESVEYIVICSNSDGCHPDMSTMASALRAAFSINVQLINAMTDDSRSSALKTAIRASRGKFTAFVGAGTMVARGWLTLLLSTFDEWKETGLAGCSIYTPSQNSIQLGGRVGQAGELSYKTLLWPQEEDSGELYLTWPDFVDTDCAMARTDIARSVLATAPMYGGLHADVDLAYAMRRSGYNVVMQPVAFSGSEDASKDTHINNNNSNSDGGDIGGQALSSSIMSGNVQSQQHLSQHMFGSEQDKVTFLSRYMGAVSQQCTKDGDAAKPSILWIEDSVPMPDRDSGSVRFRGLMKILLREGYNVAMLPLRTADPMYALQANALGVKVLPLLRIDSDHFDEKLGAGTTVISEEDGSSITKPGVLTGCPYSAIIIGRRGNYNVTEHLLSTTCPSTPLVFDTVDIHFLREMRTEALRRGHTGFSSWESLLKWANIHLPILAAKGIKVAESLLMHRDRELELIAKANITWVVSSDEAGVIASYLSGIGHKVGLITNVFETNGGSRNSGGGCEKRRGMLFVGNYDHIPNQQAVEFLLVYILPKLREKRPDLMEDLHLHLVGSGQLPTKLESLLDQNNQFVTYHGYQSDEVLDAFYKGVKVALAPLLVGAGVKGKINQAMHLGVPVVATPVGVEGMHAEHGVDCLIASEPEEFSEAIINVATDCELWERLVEGGGKNIEGHFSDVVARKVVVETLSAMGAGPKPGCVLVSAAQ
jgi:O-antigen biosynthesis protein